MEKRLSTEQAAREAVEAALEAQPGWYRSKSTLINILQGVVWIIGVVTPLLTSAPEWVALLVGGVGMLAAAGLSRLTPGEFTPSMAERVARFAPDIVTVAERSRGNVQSLVPDNYPIPSFPVVSASGAEPYAPRHAATPHDTANLSGNGSTLAIVAGERVESGSDYSAYMRGRKGV